MAQHMRTARSCPQLLDSAKGILPVEVLHATTVSPPKYTCLPTLTHPASASLSTWGNLAMPNPLPTIWLLLLEGVKAVALEAIG